MRAFLIVIGISLILVKVEACVRSKGTHSVAIIINHTISQQHVVLPNAATDLLAAGNSAISAVDLPKYGVAVVDLSK